MSDKNFLDVKDVSVYMGVSISMAYKVIRELNKELAGLGYVTVQGRISRKYFETKVFGFAS